MKEKRPPEIREPFDIERYASYHEGYVIDYEKSTLHEIVYKLVLPGFTYKYDRSSDKTEYSIPFCEPEHVFIGESYFSQADDYDDLMEFAEYFKDTVKWLDFTMVRDYHYDNGHSEYKMIPTNAVMKIDTAKDDNGFMCARFKKIDFKLKNK